MPLGESGVAGVNYVGKIDIEKYKVVTPDIVTDEVVITDNQIAHIKERHPNDYERFAGYLPQIIMEPDYILEANKLYTAVVLKTITDSNEDFQLVLRLKTLKDPEDYKNSIITFMKISRKRYALYLKSKKVLYKKE